MAVDQEQTMRGGRERERRGPEQDLGDTANGLETTRREFLALSTGAIAAAALPAEVLAAQRPMAAAVPAVRGPAPFPIALTVNGVTRRLAVSPGATLAGVLRDRLGLTGTKVGCDRGACSACTVLLDGEPVSACMTLAVDVGAREVTTIEGLATARGLNPVQRAFVAHDAMQCGFCTPGMVMSCVALLARNPSPTLEDVRAATSGNVCRCGTYPKVFEAVLSVASTTARRG